MICDDACPYMGLGYVGPRGRVSKQLPADCYLFITQMVSPIGHGSIPNQSNTSGLTTTFKSLRENR